MQITEALGYAEARGALRQILAGELAVWFAGETTSYQAGRIAALVGAVSRLRGSESGRGELRRAAGNAHLLNRLLERPCGCGTSSECGAVPPVPLAEFDVAGCFYGDGYQDLASRWEGSAGTDWLDRWDVGEPEPQALVARTAIRA